MTEILLSSAVLVLALALLRRVLRGRIDPRLQYGLWLLVALRLLIPGALFPAPVSIAGAAASWSESISAALAPSQDSGADAAVPGSQTVSGGAVSSSQTGSDTGSAGPASQAGRDTAAALGSGTDTMAPSAGGSVPQSDAGAAASFPEAEGGSAVERVLSLLDPLYDRYTKTAEYPIGTSREQWNQDILDQGYFVNGWQVDLAGGRQIVIYSEYPNIFAMPFWRWPWYAGMALMGCLLAGTNLHFALTLRKKRRRLSPEALPAGFRTPVYLVEGLASPCLCGLLRPAIYINEQSLVPGRLEHILAHEQTHLRHGDHLWALLRMACLCVYWFDPFVWWAAVLSRRDGELACDHSAIRRLGEDRRLDYGQTLVDMIAPGRPFSCLLHTATTMADKKRTMKERLLLIVRRPHMALLTLVLILAGTAAAVVLTFGGSQAAAAVVPSAAAQDTQPAPGITQAEALALYQEARTVWDWFDLGTLPTGQETLEADDSRYFRVEGFDSLSELRDYLLTLFSPALTDQLLTGCQPFQETEDALFVLPAQRGSGIYAGEESLQVFLMEPEEAEQYGYDGHIYETREVLDEDLATVLYHKRHDWFFLWDGSHYVFTSFGPSDDGDPQLYYNAREILAAIQEDGDTSAWLPLLLNMDWAALEAAGGDGFDLPMAVQSALYAYVEAQGQALTGNDYWYILSACQGLDGAYAEGYQSILWLLYEAQPQRFASAALRQLTAEQQDQILDLFRWAYSQQEGGEAMTAAEALALLQEQLPAYALLSSVSYTHSSGLFSLTLPEDWVGAVAYAETEDGVSFYEAATYEAWLRSAAEGDGLLLAIIPQPADYEDGSARTVLAEFDLNGTPYIYQAREARIEQALEEQKETFYQLFSQRDQISFRLLATEGSICRLIHDSYESDMASAIPYLPYLSWSSYRDSYGDRELEALLFALSDYALGGRADWDQVHDILSVPVDEAIDGAYAAAYQDILVGLYQADWTTFASVVQSPYISEAERDNVVYWLRSPLAEELGRSEALSDEEVRELLGLGDAGETSDEEGLLSMPGEMMNGFMRGWAPGVTSLGNTYPVETSVRDNWSLDAIAQAIQASLEQSLAGTNKAEQLTDVMVSYDFSLPENVRSGDVLEIPYYAMFSTVYTMEGYAPEEFSLSGGPFTAQVTLAGDGSLSASPEFLDRQAIYRQLESCTQGISLEAVSGSDFDLSPSVQDAIEAKLEAAGLAGEYRVTVLSLGSFTQPASLSPGAVQTISGFVGFSPTGESGIATPDIPFSITCTTVAE